MVIVVLTALIFRLFKLLQLFCNNAFAMPSLDYFTKFRRAGAPDRLGAFNLTPNNMPVIDAKIILTETSDFLLSRFLNLMDVEHAVPT